MEIEKQVCSLPLAQRLKELGVKQESLFHWREVQIPTSEWVVTFRPLGGFDSQFSAFTVAELGDMLPSMVEKEWGTGFLEASKTIPRGWRVAYDDFQHNEYLPRVEADTEADARAKMLIYLLENKLITV